MCSVVRYSNMLEVRVGETYLLCPTGDVYIVKRTVSAESIAMGNDSLKSVQWIWRNGRYTATEGVEWHDAASRTQKGVKAQQPVCRMKGTKWHTPPHQTRQ
jgi:hypothetical protein